MRTVYTKAEFEQAIKDHESKILCKGEAAKPFIRKRKAKRVIIAGGVLTAIAGAVAIPFTGGVSATATAEGIGAIATAGLIASSTATGATVTLSTAELALILGAATTITGMVIGGKVRFVVDSKNGTISVEFEPNYKN